MYDEGTADLGNNLQVSKTSSQPTVSYSDAESSQLYTVGKEHDSHCLLFSILAPQPWWILMLLHVTTLELLSGTTGLSLTLRVI